MYFSAGRNINGLLNRHNVLIMAHQATKINRTG
jgi:hypothetical protein